MRVVAIRAHGGPEMLVLQERPDPAPGRGQVLVDVRAAGVNFADTMARVGLYDAAPPPPCVVGYEVAGVVAAVGPGVDTGLVGTRVMAATRFGGYASRVVVAAADAIALPDDLTFPQAAAIPVNYATAYAALVEYGAVGPGRRVLIHAAAGGVGIAATQIAKRFGAHVLGTASPAKHAALREHGVDEPLDYTRRGWHRAIAPVDLVLDALGGASFARSYRLLRPGGRLVAYGASSVMTGEERSVLRILPRALPMLRGFNLLRQMEDSKAVIGLNMLALWDDRGTLEPWIAPLRALLEDGTIRPVVAAEVPFARAAEAHRMIGERRNIGKVVLVP